MTLSSRVNSTISTKTALLMASSLFITTPAIAKYEYSPFKLSVAHVSTGTADVGNDGNQLKRNVWMMDLEASMSINRQWSIGASVGYDNLDYGWHVNQDSDIITASVPWDSINRYEVGLSVNYRPNKHWMFIASPKMQYAYANTASSSNARSYGLVAMGLYRYESGNSIGLGAAYLNDIEESKVVPFLAIDWQLSERWSLANPFQVGFSGPAGLELRYQLNQDWDFSVGSSRRTQRFLIENDDITVEIEEWVGFLRAGWQLSKSTSLSAYAGYYFGGEMNLSSPDITEDIENQVAGALAFDVKF
ncbi:DUF6268 family outer membrane beta-barrel protein [Shewanella maritima]|uniref:DUF6268 family outer membrane beta-barrel protein n=1 Tax=Shewanella maritima TaxID=2520507 RepID=UPI003736BF5D